MAIGFKTTLTCDRCGRDFSYWATDSAPPLTAQGIRLIARIRVGWRTRSLRHPDRDDVCERGLPAEPAREPGDPSDPGD
jgi:hypothetical protein